MIAKGLKWRSINSNESWIDLKSYTFEGNKNNLPLPFSGQLIPSNTLYGKGFSCKLTNNSIKAKKNFFFSF